MAKDYLNVIERALMMGISDKINTAVTGDVFVYGEFPETEDLDANGEQDSFEDLIAKIAKRRQKSTEDIHAEIMNWPTKK